MFKSDVKPKQTNINNNYFQISKNFFYPNHGHFNRKGYLDCPRCPNLRGFTDGYTIFKILPKSAAPRDFCWWVSQYALQKKISDTDFYQDY